MSKKDFDALVQLIKTTVKEEIDPIKEIVKFLPTKDLFLSKMAELMSEVKAMRESQEIHARQHTTINDEIVGLKSRVSKVEKTLQTS